MVQRTPVRNGDRSNMIWGCFSASSEALQISKGNVNAAMFQYIIVENIITLSKKGKKTTLT